MLKPWPRGGMVDTTDLKSVPSGVPVRVWSRLPKYFYEYVLCLKLIHVRFCNDWHK